MTKFSWMWRWQDKQGIWHMTPNEAEAEIALHLGNYVIGERIDDIIVDVKT